MMVTVLPLWWLIDGRTYVGGVEPIAAQCQEAQQYERRGHDRETDRDRDLGVVRLVDVAAGRRHVPAEGEHERVEPRSERQAERLTGGPDTGDHADPVLARTRGVDGRDVGQHREWEHLRARVPDARDRRRGVHDCGRARQRGEQAEGAGGEERGRDRIAAPLAVPAGET